MSEKIGDGLIPGAAVVGEKLTTVQLPSSARDDLKRIALDLPDEFPSLRACSTAAARDFVHKWMPKVERRRRAALAAAASGKCSRVYKSIG